MNLLNTNFPSPKIRFVPLSAKEGVKNTVDPHYSPIVPNDPTIVHRFYLGLIIRCQHFPILARLGPLYPSEKRGLIV